MAASTKDFPRDFIWPRAGARVRRFSASEPPVPARSLQQDPGCCAFWLLPPERPTGLEAVVQAVSKSAGVVLLLATVMGLIWLVVA